MLFRFAPDNSNKSVKVFFFKNAIQKGHFKPDRPAGHTKSRWPTDNGNVVVGLKGFQIRK